MEPGGWLDPPGSSKPYSYGPWQNVGPILDCENVLTKYKALKKQQNEDSFHWRHR